MKQQTWIYNNHNHTGKYFGLRGFEYNVQGILDKDWEEIQHLPNTILSLKRTEETIEELDLWLTENEIRFPNYLILKTGCGVYGDDREGLKIIFNESTKRTSLDVKWDLKRLWINQLDNDDFPFDIEKSVCLIFEKEV